MTDQNIKAITLFFFFTTLDEKRALRAAAETLELIHRKKSFKNSQNMAPKIIQATQQIWLRHQKNLLRGRPQFSLESGWRLPEKMDFSPWIEFQKMAVIEELTILTWSKILRFSPSDIAKGLGLSEGTVRFRIGRALHRLGSCCRANEKVFSLRSPHG